MNFILKRNILHDVMQTIVFRQVFLICGILALVHVLEMLGMIPLTMVSFIPLFRLGGCSDCGNSDGGGGGGGGSTPFLCTWDGNKFQFENDILFGKPTSLFQTAEEGRFAYENSHIEGDLYRIQNTIQQKGGTLAFQIKEVEPEESFFDHLSLLHVKYPKNGELFVDSTYKRFWIFEKGAIRKKDGVTQQTIFDHNRNDITNRIGSVLNGSWHHEDTNVHTMEEDETIEIKGVVADRSRPLFLFLGSHYRDWTLGEIFDASNQNTIKTKIRSTFSTHFSTGAFSRGAVRIVGLLFLLGVVSVIGAANHIFRFSSPEVTSKNYDLGNLAAILGTKEARADAPGNGRSLIVEYWNENVFQKVDVVYPRYCHSNVEVVAIPTEAIQESGEVIVRVRATKRHNVTAAFLAAPQKHLSSKVDTLKVSRAFHHRTQQDYANILNQKNSKEYLHTIPADVVDVEFNMSPSRKNSASSQQEAYLIRAGGYYTPASEETQRLAGDWVAKLDPEAREWLKEMYSLKDYRRRDRTPVLS